jgi:hypothetical protein
VLAATLALSACGGSAGGTRTVADPPVRSTSSEPLLTAGGECEAGGVPFTGAPKATEIAPGIGECDLVKLKGAAPTDVLVGESGKGQREAQVLYNEPGGREIYLFTDNKLTRIVKPGQG